MNYGVDRYKRPQRISLYEEQKRQQEREDYLQSQVNELWRTIPTSQQESKKHERRFPEEPQENILYFIEKNAPLLESWQREVIRIDEKFYNTFTPKSKRR